MKYRKHPERILRHVASAPFIYGMIVPLMALDVCTEVYHRVCFPLYGIPCVKRSKYIKIDRHRLAYLNWIDKANCAYCGYANGLAHYLTQIAGETEKYWCGIKHQAENGFVEPKHHSRFSKYGDQEGWEEQYCKLGHPPSSSGLRRTRSSKN